MNSSNWSSNPSASGVKAPPARIPIYEPTLSRVRKVFVQRMARPEEVLIVD
jgi:hypothetical protein